MTNSKRIAGLVGPTLIAVTITEWLNLDVFVEAMGPSFAPHVYLNGTLLFVAGLAIVRAHPQWMLGWPVLITLIGWFALIGGLGRMVAPLSAQHVGESPAFLYGTLVVLFLIGVVLSFKSVSRNPG